MLHALKAFHIGASYTSLATCAGVRLPLLLPDLTGQSRSECTLHKSKEKCTGIKINKEGLLFWCRLTFGTTHGFTKLIYKVLSIGSLNMQTYSINMHLVAWRFNLTPDGFSATVRSVTHLFIIYTSVLPLLDIFHKCLYTHLLNSFCPEQGMGQKAKEKSHCTHRRIEIQEIIQEKCLGLVL